jgi:hypothetical protein
MNSSFRGSLKECHFKEYGERAISDDEIDLMLIQITKPEENLRSFRRNVENILTFL